VVVKDDVYYPLFTSKERRDAGWNPKPLGKGGYQGISI
jgi:hypothetical protein